MSNSGKFLSSLYRNETVTSIIEEAINGKFQLLFIDHKTGVERILSRGDLSAIRDKGFNKKIKVQIEAPSSRLIAGNDWVLARQEITSFGRTQNVGYSDLRADEKNLSLIETIADKGDLKSKNILALHALKNPQSAATFVKQQYVALNQQVNNVPAIESQKIKSENKLMESKKAISRMNALKHAGNTAVMRDISRFITECGCFLKSQT